jgi:hypothetical protein
LLAKDKNAQTALPLAARHVCWRSLKWCEGKQNWNEFKNNCFLAKVVDGENAFVIGAKNLLIPVFMKSEILKQPDHYF